MCDPMTMAMISTAASGVGGAVNANIQNSAINEQNQQNKIAMEGERAARIAEEGRQLEMERLQANEIKQALNVANPTRITEDAASYAESPDNEIVRSAELYNTPFLDGQMQNTDIGRSIGETVSKGMQRTKEMLRAQATLSGQATGHQGAQDAITHMGSGVQTIGSNRRASGNVARLETTIPAAEVSPADSILGDILMLGGNLGAGFGGKAAGKAGFQIGNVFRKPSQALHSGGR